MFLCFISNSSKNILSTFKQAFYKRSFLDRSHARVPGLIYFAPIFVTVTTEQINTTVILIYNSHHIYMKNSQNQVYLLTGGQLGV